jgi:hypothetical protein
LQDKIVWYIQSQHIYRIWIPSRHKIIETRQVRFPPLQSGKVELEDVYNPITEATSQPTSKTELSSSDPSLKYKTSADDQLQTEYKQSTSTDMPGTFDDSDLSNLESEPDISQREFKPKNFIGPLDLSKKSQLSPASPTPVNEIQTNRKRSKPKCFSEEHGKYYGKGRELDTFDIFEFAYSIQNSLDEPTIYQQTQSRSDSDKWDAAVKEELDFRIQKLNMRISAHRPTHQWVVDCRWSFENQI